MIGALTPDVIEERFADLLKDTILVRFERGLRALGGVKDKAHRFGMVQALSSF